MTYMTDKKQDFAKETPAQYAQRHRNYIRQKCNKVPGTSKKEWVSPDGALLHFRHVYMKPFTWLMLDDLARNQGISGSEAVERLIAKAAGYDIAIQR